MNGLRHPAQGDTSGWYLWCGEEFSTSTEFFQPLHASHVYEEFPDNHSDIDYRLDSSLPYLYQALRP